MGSFLSVAGPVALIAFMVFGGALLARNLFGSAHTPDGDTVRNRLEGRGPNHQPMDHPNQQPGQNDDPFHDGRYHFPT
jgi:hypothetical protein